MRTLVFLLLGGLVVSASAQEAWFLSMPKKYSTFLFKKAEAGDGKAVTAIIGKLDPLIKKGSIRQIERIKLNSDAGGTINPIKTIETENGPQSIGARYTGTTDRRSFTLTAGPGKKSYSFATVGDLGQVWSPTLLLSEGEIDHIFLERFADTNVDFVKPSSQLGLQWNLGDLTQEKMPKRFQVTWFTSQPRDDESFEFFRMSTYGKGENFREIGITMLLPTGGDSRTINFSHSFPLADKTGTGLLVLEGDVSADSTGAFKSQIDTDAPSGPPTVKEGPETGKYLFIQK